MTALQIRRKLDKAGIATNSVRGVQVFIPTGDYPDAPDGWRVLITCRRDEVEINALDRDGDTDRDMIDTWRHLVERAISCNAGYRCGYGAWVCQLGATILYRHD